MLSHFTVFYKLLIARAPKKPRQDNSLAHTRATLIGALLRLRFRRGALTSERARARRPEPSHCSVVSRGRLAARRVHTGFPEIRIQFAEAAGGLAEVESGLHRFSCQYSRPIEPARISRDA